MTGCVAAVGEKKVQGGAMAANGPNSFGIRDNHTRCKVTDFLDLAGKK
jgi:hypothetical protein